MQPGILHTKGSKEYHLERTGLLELYELDLSRELLICVLEARFYMNGPSKLAAPVSSKQFFGLQLCF